ncbi:hypothetical protein JZ751_022455 [Albula glossodonta]|uniref:Uncharacterized protein n=1 Tax=Albula glossodonta TaxID=121402 RepID=A0A8T2NHQ7_9TELE|nr:hypothetical protein JZ751_022455 [Albula glossodonta]
MNHERAQVLDSLLVEEAQPGIDSGNSLFLTQHDEQPVRTLRRRRAEENAARQVYIESSNDEESPDTPDKARNPPVKLKSSPKSPPLNWRGKNYYSTLDLPFYDDLDKKKFLRRRQAFIIEELKTLIPEYRVPREGFNPWQEGTSTPAAVTEMKMMAVGVKEQMERNHSSYRTPALRMMTPVVRQISEVWMSHSRGRKVPCHLCQFLSRLLLRILKCRRMLKSHHIKV